MERLGKRGPDQDAGTSGNRPTRPEDEGIGTDGAPQGGGLDRALSPGPDPGQPGRAPSPCPGDPSPRPLDARRDDDSGEPSAEHIARYGAYPNRPGGPAAAIPPEEGRAAPCP